MKIKVSSRPERFRRAGIEFTREPREVDVDGKTFKSIESEPLLVVEKAEKEKDPGKG